MAAGLDLGLEEVHLAICLLGRGLDGCLVLAGDSAGGGAIHIVLGFVLGFLGFQNGGGHTRNTGIGLHILVMHGPS